MPLQPFFRVGFRRVWCLGAPEARLFDVHFLDSVEDLVLEKVRSLVAFDLFSSACFGHAPMFALFFRELPGRVFSSHMSWDT